MCLNFDRERLDPLELLAPLDLRDLEESLVQMVLLAPLVPLWVNKYAGESVKIGSEWVKVFVLLGQILHRLDDFSASLGLLLSLLYSFVVCPIIISDVAFWPFDHILVSSIIAISHNYPSISLCTCVLIS